MTSFFVYIVRCSDGSYYVGHTDNIEARLSSHRNKIYRGYTSSRLPIELVFIQDFATRDEAFTCERQIKGWSRKKKEALIAGNWEKISQFSKKIF